MSLTKKEIEELSTFSSDSIQKAFAKILEEIDSLYLKCYDQPKCIILGGQPGSGKTRLERKAVQDVLGKEKYLFINVDSYREDHPNFKKVNAISVDDAYDVTKKFVGQLSRKISKYARDNRYNIILESTLQNPNITKDVSDEFRAAGYKIAIAVVAVDKNISWERTITRAKLQQDTGQTPRTIKKENHDRIAKNLAENVGIILKEGYCDQLLIYSDNNLIFDSAKGNYTKELLDKIVNTDSY